MDNNKKLAATRLIALGLIGLNSVLAHFGYNPIPVSEDVIYQFVSDVLLFATMYYTAYKNNDTKDEAIAGTAVMKQLKGEKLNPDEVKALNQAKQKI